MKLAICPECGELIECNESDMLDDDDIVGCGQEEGDFVSCHECGNNFNSDACKELRDDGGWTPTMAKDYKNEAAGL